MTRGPKFKKGQQVHDRMYNRVAIIFEVLENFAGFGHHAYSIGQDENRTSVRYEGALKEV